MKRLIDFSVSAILLIVSIPVMLVIAVIVLVSMGRPILFAQKRAGLLGKPFQIYKFRTMSIRQDAAGNLLHDSQRLTFCGSILRKLSIDELPQLINVLKGDMSLVGPRPLLMEYIPLYTPEQTKRHSVRPGITGLAQINGRNAISWEEKFVLDGWYVDNQSMKLDIKIFFSTFKTILSKTGVSMQGEATTQKFTGSE